LKGRIDPIEWILAIAIGLFLFFCMILVKDSGKERVIEYNPPCSMTHQLTILEEYRCGKI